MCKGVRSECVGLRSVSKTMNPEVRFYRVFQGLHPPHSVSLESLKSGLGGGGGEGEGRRVSAGPKA